MLRTNLATRPFYNERLVHVLLGIGLALVLALTAYNVTRLVSLSRAQAELSAAASRDEARAAEFSSRAAAIRRSIDPKALERVTAAATEANGLISARAFSWTALFNDIEATLPPSVMLVSVTQGTARDKDAQGLRVLFVVHGKTVEAVDTFIEHLEATGRFRKLIAPSEQLTDEGLIETTIDAEYLQSTPRPPQPSGPAKPAPAPARTPTTGGTR